MSSPAPTRQFDEPVPPGDAAVLALLRELIAEVKVLTEEVRRLRQGWNG